MTLGVLAYNFPINMNTNILAQQKCMTMWRKFHYKLYN